LLTEAPDAEAVLLSLRRLLTLEVIPELEHRFRRCR